MRRDDSGQGCAVTQRKLRYSSNVIVFFFFFFCFVQLIRPLMQVVVRQVVNSSSNRFKEGLQLLNHQGRSFVVFSANNQPLEHHLVQLQLLLLLLLWVSSICTVFYNRVIRHFDLEMQVTTHLSNLVIIYNLTTFLFPFN